VKPILGVVGATGSGKTALAIALAQRLGLEILSADSMQFYRGMEIGTAAPTMEERAQAPHHFVAFLSPDAYMSASDYAAMARAKLEALEQADGMEEKKFSAIVCGGSGLYVSALINGLFEGPGRDEAVRARLQAEAQQLGAGPLFARLRTVDPGYAAALTSSNDLIRIVRALEVYEVTGRPYSAWHAEHQASRDTLEARLFALDWPREVLYARINRRVVQMVEQGWVDEVRALVAAGYEADLSRLKALGYREIAAYLRGEQSLEEAIALTQMHHRRYAKRQLSWFRNVMPVAWVPAGGCEEMAENIIGRL
jgi:tRNA dimethylallyltransferase